MAHKKYKELDINGWTILVDPEGKIFFHNGRKLKITTVNRPNNNSIEMISINDKSHYVNRIVAMAHIPNPDNLPIVAHNDGDTLNNDMNNLTWCTQSTVVQNMQSLGRFPIAKPRAKKSRHKYSEADEKVIVQRLKQGETCKDIAVAYGTSDMSIIRLKQKHGIETNTTPVYKNKFDALLDLANGKSVMEVAKAHNVPYHTVYRWNKRFIVEPQKIKSDGIS